MKITNEKLENAKVNYKKGAVQGNLDAAQALIKFFEDGLNAIFWAEHELTKALPKLAENPTSSKLIHAFKHHLN